MEFENGDAKDLNKDGVFQRMVQKTMKKSRTAKIVIG